jgi:PAS domain-containing protein
MKPPRSSRLRAKLVASYTLLGVGITLMSLVGGRFAQADAYRENLRLGELLRSTEEIATLAKSASEEGLAFVVSGDTEERHTFFQSLDRAEAKARSVQDGASITTGEREVLATIVACGEHVRGVGPDMFRTYAETNAVSREVYLAYEEAIDQLADATSALSSLASMEFERALSRARVRSDWLTLLAGLLAVAAAAAVGTTLGHRITAPLLSLRSAVLAFGAGNPDVRIDKKSDDEIGELATAFERMAAETRRHTEQRFEDIFSSITDALVVCKQDRTIRAVNAACCRASGYAELDMVGQPLSLVFAASDLGEGADQETELKTADGRHVPIRLTASRLRGQGEDGMVFIAHDLTERQRLEAQLRTAQKMEAIGRLAGGIAPVSAPRSSRSSSSRSAASSSPSDGP